MSDQVIALPAPEKGWVMYQDGKEISRNDRLAGLIGNRVGVSIGFPASQIATFPVVMPAVDAEFHENMVHSQVEKRGLIGRSTGENGEVLFDFTIVAQSAQENTFAVSVVSGVGGELIVPNAGNYQSSAALYSCEPGGCLLWKERGRLVLAIYSGKEPVHLQMLGGGAEIGESVAREVNLILLGLNGEPAMSGCLPSSLELLIIGGEEEGIQSFSDHLSIPVKVLSRPVVARSRDSERLLPGAVTRIRQARRRRRQATLIGCIVLVVYLVGIAWLWVKARDTEAKIESLEKQIAIVEPDVDWIQRVDQRWRNLEPAFEKSWFPVVQLSRITAALPGSGVVIREFRTSGRNIRIRGQARDVQLANRLLEDLQALDDFSQYDWSMPNPGVEKNNTATFDIEGKPKNAGAEN